MDPLVTVLVLLNIASWSTLAYFFFGPEVETDED